MGKESRFVWKHTLTEISGYVMSFQYQVMKSTYTSFFYDSIYTEQSTVLCFSETNLSNQSYENISKFMPGWDGIHKLTNHGFAICFDNEKVKIIREYQVTSLLEVLPVLQSWS